MLSQSDIKKLAGIQSMITGAKTEGELIAASAALTRMLVRHNLEMAELDEITGKLTKKSKFTNMMGTTETNAVWKKDLMALISYYNFCHIVWYTNSRPRFMIVGTKENLEAARDLYQHTNRIIEHLGETGYVRYMKSCRENKIREVLHGREWKTSFYLGAVQGFREAFQEATESEEKAITSGSAIATLLHDEVKAAAHELFEEKPKAMAKVKVSTNKEAYAKGKTEGKKLNTKVAKQLQTV